MRAEWFLEHSGCGWRGQSKEVSNIREPLSISTSLPPPTPLPWRNRFAYYFRLWVNVRRKLYKINRNILPGCQPRRDFHTEIGEARLSTRAPPPSRFSTIGMDWVGIPPVFFGSNRYWSSFHQKTVVPALTPVPSGANLSRRCRIWLLPTRSPASPPRASAWLGSFPARCSFLNILGFPHNLAFSCSPCGAVRGRAASCPQHQNIQLEALENLEDRPGDHAQPRAPVRDPR